MEAVAAVRRKLPLGGVVPEDYVFQGAGADGTATDVKLSELFEPGRDSLVTSRGCCLHVRGENGEKSPQY
jgi:predicted dithiol-disulfide oxidoreductase (DUF899 family)